MKPRDVLACCFAGYGIYLAFSGLVGAVASVAVTISIARDTHESVTGWQLVQYSFGLFPLLVGLLLATMSGLLGRLAARFACLDGAVSWSIQIGARELLAVFFAAIGGYLVATQSAEVLRQLVLTFLGNAGDRGIHEMATRWGANPSFLITHASCAAAGALLMSKCNTLAGRLMPPKNSG